ncbi:MAG TPA: hypothetical protein DER01_19580 [Phycisphaerales bacterium]|nr:hypothetical protein [Phycisphaerales bacterium]|tara:strand:+ start:2485 stop:3165 length:681 start_codon:yes stop_codon:yes gene_type:complete
MILTTNTTINAYAEHLQQLLRRSTAPLLSSGHTMQTQAQQSSETDVDQLDLQDVQASQDGDDQAYGRIVRRHQQEIAKRLWRFSRVQQVLEELVQETFVQAWQSLHTYRADAPLIHWLTRIATRVGYRHWKQEFKRRRQSYNLTEQIADTLISTDDDPHEVAEFVHRLLAELSPRDRMVLTLMYLEQCTVQEVAQQTGWSKVMVKVQAHRARAKLRRLIEKRQKQP